MKHYLNGVEISPKDIDNIGFKSDWSKSIGLADRDSRELYPNTTSITLVNEAKELVMNWFSTYGNTMGMPYDMKMADQTVNYFIDFTKKFDVSDYEVTVTLVRRGAYQSFFEYAQGASFELINAKGFVFDTFNVPYIIIPPNQVEMGAMLSIAIFTISKALIDAFHETVKQGSELIEALFPDLGTIPPQPVVKPGTIILMSIKFALQVAYTILLIIELIKLSQQLFELIFPKVRNFKACKVKELIEKGCQSYGYTLSSSLLNSLSGLTVLPVPLVKAKHKGFKSFFDFIQNDLNFAYTKGFPTSQDSTPTLWSLIEQVENIFNAETRIINNVVRIERKGFFANQANVQIQSSLVLQDTRQNKYSINSFDGWKRTYIHYQPDFTDLNTVDDFDLCDAEYSAEPTQVVATDLTTIHGLNDINIPFSLGTRKTKLNWIEKLAKGFFQILDTFANTSLAAQIDNRVGVLIVTSQFYSTSKLLWTVNGKQPSNYSDYISPAVLWGSYHYLNQIQQNGYKIKESVKILMNEDIFVNLLDNNFCEIDGVVCEIVSMEYQDRDSFAIITYREPFNYNLGKVTTLTLDE